MTVVKVERNFGHIVAIEASGHTGFGMEGEDIVCAALSSIIQTAVLGLMSVAGLKIELERNDEDGYLKAQLPENISETDRHNADIILETMLLGIADIYESYSDFIKLEVKNVH